jgi:hypothetical protein
MTNNVIGFRNDQIQMQSKTVSPRDRGMGAAPELRGNLAIAGDRLEISHEAAGRLEGLPEVDAPKVNSLSEALEMARNTVQMMLERPDQARAAHLPDIGARVAGLIA